MSSPDVKLSLCLQEIARHLETLLAAATDLPRVPFVLVAQPGANAQYVANVSRADGTALLQGLLRRWGDPAQPPGDLPEHDKLAALQRLVLACEAYHQALDMAFAQLADATRGRPGEPFFPSRSPMWPAIVEGRAAVAAVRAAMAWGETIAEAGTIAVPPAKDFH